jgi:hypothetical protein
MAVRHRAIIELEKTGYFEEWYGDGPALVQRDGHLIKMLYIARENRVVEQYSDLRILPVISAKTAVKWALSDLRANGGICQAMVAGCLEPLKCRIITKGSGIPYWAAQPFQRAMWNRLQDFAPFALTGRPLDASDLSGILLKEEKLGLLFDAWVSGDYSAATDGLSQQINQLCLQEAIDGAGLTRDEATVARAVLGNHEISYPLEFHSVLPAPSIMQRNGQLMGSVLSFPILCAINVCAYWMALEEYTGRRFELNDLPCLVNGDDICFRANKEFYPIWQKWTARAGFTLSPGKNYLAQDFVTINSEGYHFRPGKHCSTFTKLGFLNTGLLYSAKAEKEVDYREHKTKVGIRGELKEMPFTQKINKLLEGAHDPLRTYLRVHAFYGHEIRHHTWNGAINMHAAPELGGLGVMLPKGQTTRFTGWQQQIAGYLRHKWRSEEFGTRLQSEDEVMTAKFWDLNAPMGLEGRTTYKCVRAPAVRRVHPVRPGQVVVRNKLEPMREGEKRWTMPSSDLLNYQSEPDESQGQWKIQALDGDDVAASRKYSGSRVLEPLIWTEEVRERQAVVELPKLYRTDTSTFLSYRDADGATIVFTPQCH